MNRKPAGNRLIFAGLLLFMVLTAGCSLRPVGLRPWAWSQRTQIPSPAMVSIPVVDPTPSATTSPFQPLPTATITQTPTQTSTPTASATPTASITPTPTLTGTSTPTAPSPATPGDLPAQAFISGYSGGVQQYSLDCEARSAVDLALYWGIFIDENEFLERLPRSDDPNEGFVGDLNGTWGGIPPNSYGVYAGPIARLLRNYGLDAYAREMMTFDELRQEIAAGRPVIAWVVGQVEPGVPLSYTPTNGIRTTVARFEHTVTIIGYDETFVYIIDPSYNLFYMRTIDQFMQSWGVLNNMAVVTE